MAVTVDTSTCDPHLGSISFKVNKNCLSVFEGAVLLKLEIPKKVTLTHEI